MNKQNVVYTYAEIEFSPKKEGNCDACYNMDETWDVMLSDTSHSQKYKYCMTALIWGTKSTQVHRDLKSNYTHLTR